MSEANVEMIRTSYAVYNAALTASNRREAIRAWLERFADPEIEWETEPTARFTAQGFHGIDGVMEFFDAILDAFESVRQVPEPFIDCGDDRIVVFVRTEAQARTPGPEIDEEWAHLITVRDGKSARVQVFRNREEALEAAGMRE
jgi:ketosteroid isomerase-like protein